MTLEFKTGYSGVTRYIFQWAESLQSISPEVRDVVLCLKDGSTLKYIALVRPLPVGQESISYRVFSADRNSGSTIRLRPMPLLVRLAELILPALVLGVCALCLGCGATKAQAAGQSTTSASLPLVQAYQADTFVDSIGVVTHLTYTNTPYYTAWPQVFNDLQSLGVRHIRDGYYNWSAGSPFYGEHQLLASAGIHTDYVVPFSTTTTPEEIEQTAGQVQDMESLEMPNECDVAGNCGPTVAAGLGNLLGFEPTVDAAASALGIPALGPSFTQVETYPAVGNLAPSMTDNNLHIYFGGRNPGSDGWGAPDVEGNYYGSIPFWLDQANLDAPGVPSVVTETGYLTFSTPQPYTIPASVEASYIPRTLLLMYMAGVKRTYVYELLDEISSPGFGLIDGNLNPRPAYLAIQNLIANLWDKGPSFTPGQLPYSVTGGDSTLQQVLFQKRDGSFWLLLWLEQSSYDTVNCVPTPVTPQSVTLTLGGNYVAPNIGAFDDTGNLNWTSPQPASSVVPLTVSDQITIVKILPQ